MSIYFKGIVDNAIIIQSADTNINLTQEQSGSIIFSGNNSSNLDINLPASPLAGTYYKIIFNVYPVNITSIHSAVTGNVNASNWISNATNTQCFNAQSLTSIFGGGGFNTTGDFCEFYYDGNSWFAQCFSAYNKWQGS